METTILSLIGFWSYWLWPILLFVIGLGLVVFVHELGHFMVAKWVGIKVERFAFGFGKRLWGFQRGETDYCINLLPLGGYIKMPGQEDVKEVEATPDPRAFNNKSVGARFAVIAAGVVMNVIFAAVLFVVVAMVGKSYPAPVIGEVLAGMPAEGAQITWSCKGPCGACVPYTTSVPTTSSALASGPTSASAPAKMGSVGLKPGDRIVEIDGHNWLLNFIGQPVTRFTDIFMLSALAEPNSRFTFTIERQVGGRACVGEAKMGVKPAADGSQLAFGLRGAQDTVFAEFDDALTSAPFKNGDRLVSIDGKKIAHNWEIAGFEKALDGKGVVVGLERAGKDMEVTVQPILQLRDDVNWLKDGSLIRGLLVTKEGGKAQIQSTDGKMMELPEDQIAGGAGMEQLDILGMVPRLMVVLVENDSPADKAGLRPGDIIVGYGDQSAPTLHQFRQLNKQFLGKGTNITIRRDGQEKKCWVVPAVQKENIRVGVTQGLDLMHPVVAGIRDGSAAQHAGFEPESVIQAVNGQEVNSWIDVFEALRKAAGQEVMITYRVGEREKTANLGVLEKGQFDSGLYEFTLFGSDVAFHMMEVKLVERDPVKALVWGGQETGKLILSTYLSLRRIGQGTVSTKSLAGPVGIGSIAIQVGRKSLIDFIYFLAFISASLAVINFLPIPVVDGGHAVFLIIEKIRGKPLPTKVLYYAQVAGLALIVAVFVALTWQDISRIVRGMW